MSIFDEIYKLYIEKGEEHVMQVLKDQYLTRIRLIDQVDAFYYSELDFNAILNSLSFEAVCAHVFELRLSLSSNNIVFLKCFKDFYDMLSLEHAIVDSAHKLPDLGPELSDLLFKISNTYQQ